MFSLLQNIQSQVGKAAGEIPTPPLRELRVEQLEEPTIGWLPEVDYAFRPVQSGAVSLSAISSLPQTSLPLLAVPRSIVCQLGEQAETAETAAKEWRFQVKPVAHSSPRLLGEADTEELRAELQASTAPNRLRRLTKPQSISDNLNRKRQAARVFRRRWKGGYE